MRYTPLLLFLAALCACSHVNMTAEPGAKVQCHLRRPAPGQVACTSSDGKSFTWDMTGELEIKGVCPPAADGTCPGGAP